MKKTIFDCRYCETLMHLLKGNIGCGMLAMGDAFRNGGLLMAPILTVFIGTVCIYNNHILVRNKDIFERIILYALYLENGCFKSFYIFLAIKNIVKFKILAQIFQNIENL